MPLSDNEVLLYLKFGKRRWIKRLSDGEVSFSCAGAFIDQAMNSGNKAQGDEYEAAFARVHKSDSRRFEARIRLGKDIEEIDDGEFVFLRRKSAKLVPIFCSYAFTVGEVNENANLCGAGRYNVHHTPDERMYSGFSSPSVRNVLNMEQRPTLLMIRSLNLSAKMQEASLREHLCMPNRIIKYIDMTKEFFIKPTPDYSELFIKSNDYAYQLEYRWCITNKRLCSNSDRYNLSIGQFISDNEVYMLDSENGFQFGLSLEFDNNSKVIST